MLSIVNRDEIKRQKTFKRVIAKYRESRDKTTEDFDLFKNIQNGKQIQTIACSHGPLRVTWSNSGCNNLKAPATCVNGTSSINMSGVCFVWCRDMI